MQLTFDPAKNDRNVQERGLSFMLLSEFDWAKAYLVEDKRQDYGERRLRGFGLHSGSVVRRRIHAARWHASRDQSAQS